MKWRDSKSHVDLLSFRTLRNQVTFFMNNEATFFM